MSQVHRNNDLRSCGAVTVTQGQNFVKVGGQAWAVENDPDSHGNGQLIASISYVKINGKKIIVKGDNAYPDNARHTNPSAVGSASFMSVNE